MHILSFERFARNLVHVQEDRLIRWWLRLGSWWWRILRLKFLPMVSGTLMRTHFQLCWMTPLPLVIASTRRIRMQAHTVGQARVWSSLDEAPVETGSRILSCYVSGWGSQSEEEVMEQVEFGSTSHCVPAILLCHRHSSIGWKLNLSSLSVWYHPKLGNWICKRYKCLAFKKIERLLSDASRYGRI